MTTDKKKNARDAGIIGNAEMRDDGTIILNLASQQNDVVRGATQLIYPPDHKDYKQVLRHIGNIKPGEKVGVRPWPFMWVINGIKIQ